MWYIMWSYVMFQQDSDLRSQHQKEWNDIFNRLQAALRNGAKKANLSEKVQHKYHMSGKLKFSWWCPMFIFNRWNIYIRFESFFKF